MKYQCINIEELSDRIEKRFNLTGKDNNLPETYYFARFILPSGLILNIYKSKTICTQRNPKKSEITIIENMIEDINSSYFNSIKVAS